MDKTNYNKTVQTLIDLFERHSISYKLFEHEEVRTSEQAAKVRPEYSIKQGAKALIVKVKGKAGKEDTIVMLVVPGDSRFDSKKARKVLDARDITFASEDIVVKVTSGVLPGGVPPFGFVFNLPMYVDEKVLENTEIIFNAGDKRVSVAITTDNYRKLLSSYSVSIVKLTEELSR